MEDPEDINTIIAKQVQFNARRRQILEELQKLDMSVAKIYESAISVLQNDNVPNRINLSAHALREVIDKLPEYTNTPKIKNPQSLGELVKCFMDDWFQFDNKLPWETVTGWSDEEHQLSSSLVKMLNFSFQRALFLRLLKKHFQLANANF